MKRILVVEDDLVDQERLKRELKSAYNLSLSFVNSGVNALVSVELESYDCIVMDYLLNDCTGIQLIERLEQFSDTPPPPIIMLTGQGSEKVAVDAMKKGVLDYLIKDEYEPEQLIDAIDAAMKKQEREVKIRQMKQEIENASLIDPMTGLGNRYLLSNDLRLTVERAKRSEDRFAVLFFNFTDLQKVTEMHGSDVCDIVIRIIGERLKNTKASDSFYRTGQDEFAAIVPSVIGRESASEYTNTLLNELVQKIEFRGQRFNVGVNVGMAMFPYDAEEDYLLLKKADQSLRSMLHKH